MLHGNIETHRLPATELLVFSLKALESEVRMLHWGSFTGGQQDLPWVCLGALG